MSFQQVNLYNDELKDIKLKYSSSTLIRLSTIIVVAFLLFSGFINFQLNSKQDLVTASKKTQEKLKIQKIAFESAKGKKDPNLTKLITQKTTELAKKQKVLKILSQDKFGSANGFVGIVGGLAKHRLNGLWLTRLRIAGGGTDITLTGLTTKAKLLPQYLQRLSSESAFSGITFKYFTMERNKDKKHLFDFSLHNVGPIKVVRVEK